VASVDELATGTVNKIVSAASEEHSSSDYQMQIVEYEIWTTHTHANFRPIIPEFEYCDFDKLLAFVVLHWF
jgi:hypothetical protein